MDLPSTTRAPQTKSGLGVIVDFDPAVWLPGPTTQSVEDWLETAYRGCAADFSVVPDSAEATYLRALLVEFGTRDLFGDFRFLRLRALADAPLTMQLGVVFDAPAGAVAATLTTLDPDTTYYDPTAQLEDVDPARGLRRSIVFPVDDGIRPVVRYHRYVPELRADILLSSAGADLRATTEGLPQLDALAAAVWLVDETGRRR